METQQLQSSQTTLSSTLDYIESQQSQLDKELDSFESRLQTVLQQQSSKQAQTGVYGGVSAEETREYTYTLAETLSQELVGLSGEVHDMVEVVNKVWKKEEPRGAGSSGDGTNNEEQTVSRQRLNKIIP